MRFLQFDTLRGLAALSVFFSHAIGMAAIRNEWFSFFSNSPVHIFWDGAAAVKLFFVLSGFCLAIPYVGNKANRKLQYGEFVIKRVFRLYPAYFFALIVCCILKDYYYVPDEFVSEWGRSFGNGIISMEGNGYKLYP